MGNTQVASLVYNGAIIRDRGEMLSLTDMWKSAGAEHSKRPVEWLRGEHAQRFISFMAEDLGMGEVGKSHFGLVASAKGGAHGGSTFAHWQIALAYAKYLSPEFHVWCNQVVRDRMEGKAPAAIPGDVLEMLRRTDGIAKMLAHKVTEIEKAIPAMVDHVMEAKIAADPRVAVVSFVSVKQILETDWKVPPNGRRSIQRKVFLRLSAHCLANGVKAFKCAHSGTWLFPPHEAGAFVRNYCGGIIHEHMARIRGQGRLRLVGEAA